MFRHRGKSRTIKHNIRIASLLSFVAGIVNVVGVLAIHQLTTNVTGHFAFFIDESFQLNFWAGVIYFLYTFFFLLGSFISNLIVEIVFRKKERLTYVIPFLMESIILFLVAIFGTEMAISSPNTLACLLLFSMGLQNSLVTQISNSVVRTTHLTGLFTDLGIDLSQLFFYKLKEDKDRLYTSIKLRLTIIGSFFLGGIFSGLMYGAIGVHVVAFGGLLLLIGLSFGNLKYRVLRYVRRR